MGSNPSRPTMKKLSKEKEQQVLEQLEKSRKAGAPPVDEEAAARVAEAMAKMPPVSPEERKKFLDEFYGNDE